MLSVAPSIASSNQLLLGENVRRLEACGVTNLHLDIEDGNFIPNITFGLKTVRQLAGVTAMPFSVHLMVSHPGDYLDELLAIPNVTSITVNVDTEPYPRLLAQRIRQRPGVAVGFAINPSTPILRLLAYADAADMVMLMSAEPDGLGQLYSAAVLDRIATVQGGFPALPIWVDGGIRTEHLAPLARAGATCVVLGREVFDGDHIEANTERITRTLEACGCPSGQ